MKFLKNPLFLFVLIFSQLSYQAEEGEAFSQGSSSKRSPELEVRQRDLSNLIHETMFDKQHIERELNHHHEEKKELVFEDELDIKELGQGLELKKTHIK